jgi:hypothetical protein
MPHRGNTLVALAAIVVATHLLVPAAAQQQQLRELAAAATAPPAPVQPNLGRSRQLQIATALEATCGLAKFEEDVQFLDLQCCGPGECNDGLPPTTCPSAECAKALGGLKFGECAETFQRVTDTAWGSAPDGVSEPIDRLWAACGQLPLDQVQAVIDEQCAMTPPPPPPGPSGGGHRRQLTREQRKEQRRKRREQRRLQAITLTQEAIIAGLNCEDCEGVEYGPARRDACGICGGGATDPAACSQDHHQVNGACTFTFFDETPKTMRYAEDACIKDVGGHLASAHSQADADLFESLVTGNTAWIGYHDMTFEAGCTDDRHQGIGGNIAATTFVWTDGSPSDYENWAAGEPNDWQDGQARCDGSGNEDCTETWQGGATWNDAACDGEKPYICGVCPATSTNPTRFEYFADGLSQPDAEFQCTINGGHLASVHSEADSDLLDSMIDQNGGSSTWIGYHDRWDEAGCTDDRHQGIGGNIAANTFIWTDGTASDYEDWAGGEPNDWQDDAARCDGTGNEDCAEIWRSGQDWNDAGCDGTKPYICGYSEAVPSGGSAASGPASSEVVATSAHGDTVQLSYTLDADKTNVYAMAGTADQAMTFPPAFQVAAPFGTDIGGVPPAFIAVSADAAFDSWLTVGVTDGSAGTAIAASPGLGLDGWTATAAFGTSNGAIFWLNPSDGPSGTVVLAQLTGASGTATAMLQGRSADWSADWSEVASWNLSDGNAPPPPSHQTTYDGPLAVDFAGDFGFAEYRVGQNNLQACLDHCTASTRCQAAQYSSGYEDINGHGNCLLFDNQNTHGGLWRDAFVHFKNAYTGELAPAADGDPCEGGREEYDSAEINFGDGYQDGVQCSWTLVCTSGGHPTLSFESIQTEANFDYVNVYDGTDLVMSESGDTGIIQPVQGSGTVIELEFTSDGSVQGPGFVASFSCGAEPFAYTGCFNHQSGGNTATNFPDSAAIVVSSPEECSALCGGQGATLFGLTDSNGEGKQGTGTADCHCGNRELSQRLTPDQCLTCVSPTTGSTYHCGAFGWKLDVYRISSSPTADGPSGTPCSTSGRTEVNSANIDFAGGYGHNSLCSWILTCTTGHPAIVFDSFATEAGYDFLIVRDGGSDTDPVLMRESGEADDITRVWGSSGSMLMTFSSDASIAGDGFRARFSCGDNSCASAQCHGHGGTCDASARSPAPAGLRSCGICAGDDDAVCFSPPPPPSFIGNMVGVAGVLSWHDAQTYCRAHYIDLVSINSAQDNLMAKQACDRLEGRSERDFNGCWIGLNDESSEGSYQWSDGSSVDYTNFGPGEPDNYYDEDYIWMIADPSEQMESGNQFFANHRPGDWSDVSDSPSVSGFICSTDDASQTALPSCTRLDGALSASSVYGGCCPASHGVLGFTNGESWCAPGDWRPDADWLQLDLGAAHVVNAVDTQGNGLNGGQTEGVTSFRLKTSTDGRTWTNVGTFDASEFDWEAEVRNTFNAVTARYVRFYPLASHGAACLRVGVYSCFQAGSVASADVGHDPCTDGGATIVDRGTIALSDGYSDNHNCNWLLTCTDRSLAPRVTFSSFDTEANYDFLDFYDGIDISHPHIASLHGSNLCSATGLHNAGAVSPACTIGVIASQATTLVRFTSDGSVTRDGFVGVVDCVAPAPPPSVGSNCEDYDDEGSCHATHSRDTHTPDDVRNGYRIDAVCEWNNGQCETVDFSALPCCTERGNYCGEVRCPLDDNNGDARGGWTGSPSAQCGGCDEDQCCGSPTNPATTGCCWNWCICNGDHNDAFATCECNNAGHCIRNC